MSLAYIRTSIVKKEKISLDVQKEWIIKKAHELNLTTPLFYEDCGVSGHQMGNRKGVSQLIQHLKQVTNETLLVYRYNRLSRNMLELLDLLELCERQNIVVVSVMEPLPAGIGTSSAIQKVFVQLIGLVSEFQRSVTVENVRSGLKQKRRNGLPLASNPPYGYSYTQEKLLPQKEEGAVVQWLYENYLNESKGYTKLAQLLTQKGIRYRGTRFSSLHVQTILRNPVYYGVLKGGSFGSYLGTHHCLITKDQFDAVQKVRGKRQVTQKQPTTHPLQKKVPCPFCGRALGFREMKKNNKTYRYFTCSKPICPAKYQRVSPIEQEIKRVIQAFLNQADVKQRLIQEVENQSGSNMKQLKLDLAQLQKKKQALFQDFEKGKVAESEFLQRLDQLKQEKNLVHQPQASSQNQELEAFKAFLTATQKETILPVPDDFYFDLVERVEVTKDYQVSGVYLTHLEENLVEGNPISLENNS